MASISERVRAGLALTYAACMGRPLPRDLAATLQQELCWGLGARSQRAVAISLQHWMTWWEASGDGVGAGTVSALEAYVRAQEEVRTSPKSIGQRIWVISRLLELLPWPDPDAKAVLRRICRANRKRGCNSQIDPPSAKPLGWQQIQRIVALTDQHSRSAVRTLAALLLIYETMARPDQIFGFKQEGRWLVPPASRRLVSRCRRGGVIHLQPDSRGLGKRRVVLSEMTMSWLERSFVLWPGEDGPLFQTAQGNCWSRSGWRQAFHKLCKRHGFSCSPLSLRWGKTQDLLSKGVNVHDIQESAGWVLVNTVLRLLPRPIPHNPRQHLVVYEDGPTRLPDSLRPFPAHMETGDLFECATRT